MREIKFRGKRIDNGEWVNGYLANSGHQINPRIEFWWIAQNRYDYGTIFDERSCDDTFIWHRVDPETVGQYTGLEDKNGVEIYEGDLIKTDYASGIFVVAFDERYTCVSLFEAKQLSNNYITLSNRLQEEYEVIGNIYDNPELLEAKV